LHEQTAGAVLFGSRDEEAGIAAPHRAMTLESLEV
jgi:hypothetical protein